MNKIIQPAKSIHGDISVPGDKSISHRAIMFGAIARGNTTISNLSSSADVASTRSCLQQLGIDITEENSVITVAGKGLTGLSASPRELDCGNSGTTIRLISGILAAQPFTSTLIGDASLSKRPMNRIIQPLTQMGAQIVSQPGGFAPLTIHGQRLNPIAFTSPVASAQVKSCILLAGLFTEGTTTVSEPTLSRDHTERLLHDFGVTVDSDASGISIHGPATLHGCDILVPGDFSSAAFFIGAALLVSNASLLLKNIGLNPTRTGLLDVLGRMGARIIIHPSSFPSSEPMGDIEIFSSRLVGTTIEANLVPSLIDEIPILAVIAARAEGMTTLSGAGELRVKESDRLKAITQNLLKMGILIEEKDDGFIIEGPQQFKGAEVDSFHDHRIAMAFSVAGLIARGQTTILNPDCVGISMPNFYTTLEEVVDE
ncbi:MAG: 3-phosphoshikimate 1-carboxyvinyltransferase [Candidatus Zhuqueibacterota bacterium]